MPRWRSLPSPEKRRLKQRDPRDQRDGHLRTGRCLTPYPGTGHSLTFVESLTIGQLAHEAGVHVETVRYYERRGLLRQPPRTPAGYRQYGAADLRWLQFIARAKQLGFTLAEVAQLAGAHDRDEGDDSGDANGASGDNDGAKDSADAVVEAARVKLRALDERQKELDATRDRLARLIDVCADPASEDCRALRVRG
jgi:MerR family transcriptional regulator, copper efflux regulator